MKKNPLEISIRCPPIAGPITRPIDPKAEDLPRMFACFSCGKKSAISAFDNVGVCLKKPKSIPQIYLLDITYYNAIYLPINIRNINIKCID